MFKYKVHKLWPKKCKKSTFKCGLKLAVCRKLFVVLVRLKVFRTRSTGISDIMSFQKFTSKRSWFSSLSKQHTK